VGVTGGAQRNPPPQDARFGISVRIGKAHTAFIVLRRDWLSSLNIDLIYRGSNDSKAF
jgi:hypothetical protein